MVPSGNVTKIYCTVERMDSWKCSIEITIVPLKESMTETFFEHVTAEKIKDNCYYIHYCN